LERSGCYRREVRIPYEPRAVLKGLELDKDLESQ